MKPGSTVQYIGPQEGLYAPRIRDLKVPKNDTPYTVKVIKPNPTDGSPVVLLEELVCGYNKDTGREAGFGVEAYRELLPPIENIEEYINENTAVPARRLETVTALKKLTIALLFSMILCSCDEWGANDVEFEETEYTLHGCRIEMLTIDSCEYIYIRSGNSSWGSHKGNCKFCSKP